MVRGRPTKDVTGQVFYQWTVLERAPNAIRTSADGKIKSEYARWLCRCTCGTLSTVLATHLKTGRSRSCGGHSAQCAGCDARIRSGKYCRLCSRIKNNLRRIGATLTPQQYRLIFNRANGRCTACDIATEDLVLDHDHDTGQVRGVLCRPCNSAEGFFKNDYSRLLRLYEYCKRHEVAQ